MDEKSRQRLSDFIRALDDAGLKTGGKEAACHHSAVEVNDWHVIQRAMLEAATSAKKSPASGSIDPCRETGTSVETQSGSAKDGGQR